MNRKTIVSLILAFVLVVAFSSSALAAFADILSSVSGWDILEKAGGSDDTVAAIGDTIVVTIKLVSDKAAVQPDLIDGNAIKIEKTGGVTVAVDSIATISAKEFKVLYIVDSGDEDIENTRLYVGTTYYPSTRTSGINIEGIAPVITGSSSITVAPGTPAAIGDTLTYAIGTASESGVTVTAGFGWDADADSAITLSGTVATAVGSGNALTATYIVTAGDTTMADVYGWAFITDAAGNQVGTTSIGYNLDLDGEAPVISGDVVAGALADSARFYAYGVTSTEGIWVETVTELGVANLTGTYSVDLTYTPVDSTHAGVTLDASGGEKTGTLAAETDLTGVAVTTAAVLVDGVTYDIAYKATDSQTNAGATGTLASVRFDETAPTLTVFPNSTDVAELNNTVNDVIISWSEPCDSVSFKYIAAEDGLEVSQDSVVFSHAFNSAQAAAYGSGPYEWAVSAVPEDSLDYTLWVYARDYAGNEVTWKDTLLYAEAYPEPVLKQFILAASANDSVLAGETITVTITATDTAGTDRTVKTFKDTVALSMSGGSLFTWGGDAAVVAGDSLLATISPADWSAGVAEVTLNKKVAPETGTLTASNETATGTIALTWEPNAFNKYLVDVASATVTLGSAFDVTVRPTDTYGNDLLAADVDVWIELSANKPSVALPLGSQHLEEGPSTFSATATVAATDLVIYATGGGMIGATVAITAEAAAIDAPDTLFGQDYPNDNGEWVLLSWDPSTSTVDRYRIYREITVAEAETTIVDSVEVITPEAKEYIGWAEVRSYAPVGGATYIRALVATLGQTGAANYKVAAEVGGETSVTVNATLARKVSDGTVVATPAVGKMLASGDRLSSALSNAALVTATDNTAPAAITSFTAFDTPNDAGSTITVSWTLSEDDKVLSSMVYNEQLIATRGVEAYNIYRDGAFVGSAGYGVSSYQDAVDNGTYYEYEVRVTDSSNEVVSGLASAMAFAAASENASKGDWDADNSVGLADFSRFAGAYGNAAPAGTSDSIFDLDGSGTVDLGDFSIFASHYGETIGGAAKAVPVVFGKNTDVSLTMSAVEKAGLYTVQVNLNKTAEAKTYGYVMNYDVHAFEFDHAVVKSASTVPFLVQNTKPGELHIAHSIKGEAIVEVFFNVKDEFGGTVRISEARVWDQYHRANTVDLSAAAIKMLPTTFALKQNFPNPFNPTTVIGYALPEGSNVRLEIYNTLGQVVRTLVDGEQAGGVYRMTWDGRNEHGQEMATGVYIYRIVAGDFQATKRMLLIK